MNVNDIKEGEYYFNNKESNYFRLVEMIIDSPNRPGGKVVAWSTDSFDVHLSATKRGRTHGKCGIETFAKWATSSGLHNS